MLPLALPLTRLSFLRHQSHLLYCMAAFVSISLMRTPAPWELEGSSAWSLLCVSAQHSA